MLDKFKNNVVIIDYGVGNLLSVMRGVEICGATPVVTNCPEKILNAERLILPGVGAFSDGMKGLSEINLIEPIKDYVLKGRPFLGICLGMQMILDESHEFGINKGLGLIPGKVLSIPSKSSDGQDFKIPMLVGTVLDQVKKVTIGKIRFYKTLRERTQFILCILFLPCQRMKNISWPHVLMPEKTSVQLLTMKISMVVNFIQKKVAL